MRSRSAALISGMNLASGWVFGGDQTKLSAHGGHGTAAKPTEKIVEVTARVRELIGQGADPANLRVTVVPNKSTDTANARVERIELFSR
jgi:hypothetical protein